MNKLQKNIWEIFQSKYIIPLYQRYFAWEAEQVGQMIWDIYDSYKNNPKSNYYIGTLVSFPRNNGLQEVIDGQQRLTVISILGRMLDEKGIYSNLCIDFDSRPEVRNFFEKLYTGCIATAKNILGMSNYALAIEWIENWESSDYNIELPNVKFVDLKNERGFVKYFFENVYLVSEIMPADTDVAKYFEIMNNRGEQLQENDILKAKLLEYIENERERETYAKVWENVSQMDIRIQRLFPKTMGRDKLFGANYDIIYTVEELVESLDFLSGNSESENEEYNDHSEIKTLDDIIIYKGNFNASNDNNSDEDRDEKDLHSIIDFPNFLMHVMRLFQLKVSFNEDIRLNEKFLLTDFKKLKIENASDAKKFIALLLRTRVIFDRYIIKQQQTDDHNSDDNFEWRLRKPNMSESTKSLYYARTYPSDSGIWSKDVVIKALSMLQVTYRQRIYKNWLYELLVYLDKNPTPSINDYINEIHRYICKMCNDAKYEEIFKGYADFESGSSPHDGTNTNRFLFNFIDYLYYLAMIKEESLDYVNDLKDFTFRYYSSVEHHFAQKRENEKDNLWADSIGNLCLISNRSNSKLSANTPLSKAKDFQDSNLGPKRQIMYKITLYNSSRRDSAWDESEVVKHYNDIMELLKMKDKLMGLEVLLQC